jgi:hypothetical protein
MVLWVDRVNMDERSSATRERSKRFSFHGQREQLILSSIYTFNTLLLSYTGIFGALHGIGVLLHSEAAHVGGYLRYSRWLER